MRFFFGMLYEMWSDGPLGRVLALFSAAMFCGFIILIGWGVFYMADSCFVAKQRTVGEVVGHRHSDAHYITTFHKVGDVQVPITNYYPPTWSLCFKAREGEDSVGVTENFHDCTPRGERYELEYQRGRISGGFYITDILNKVSP